MHTMVKYWRLALLSGGILLGPCVWTDDALASNEFCTERPCFLRATLKGLNKKAPPNKGIELAIGKMGLHLPEKLKKVTMPSKNILTIRLVNDAGLIVRLVDNDDLLSLLPAAARAQKISLAAGKIPQIIFEKTPEDAEPSDGNDRAIWRSMIIRKKLLFSSKSHLAHFSKGKLDIYVADGVDGPFSMVAFKEGNGAYIEIQGRRLPYANFENFVTSIEAN